MSVLSSGLTGPAAFMAPSYPRLFDVITSLGLTTNLKLCLDAGDAASYASGQSWLDRSGLGHDFFLGADGSAGANDPTFNGVAGSVSASEFFSSDAGDYFTYDSANAAWMSALHQNNAAGTVFAVIRPVAGGPQYIIATATSSADTGIMIGAGSDDNLFTFTVVSNGVDRARIAATEPTANVWNGVGVAWKESDTGFFWLNGAYSQVAGADEWVASYAGPSAGDATSVMKIGALGDGSSPMPSAARIACLAVWEGTQQSKINLDAVWNAMRGRFGV